ncbi:MAG: hypothetical protein K0R50_4763 [Eubacterium sp.]|jgi:hypothetical protein|nr:hypothetical protein [Eubacterium sp.]
MDNNFKIAPLDNHEIINDISRLESELKKKSGMDIVLIAYTKAENK